MSNDYLKNFYFINPDISKERLKDIDWSLLDDNKDCITQLWGLVAPEETKSEFRTIINRIWKLKQKRKLPSFDITQSKQYVEQSDAVEDVQFEDISSDSAVTVSKGEGSGSKDFPTIINVETEFPGFLKESLESYVTKHNSKRVLWNSMYRALIDTGILKLNQKDFALLMEKTFEGVPNAIRIEKSMSDGIPHEYRDTPFSEWSKTPSLFNKKEIISTTEEIIEIINTTLREHNFNIK